MKFWRKVRSILVLAMMFTVVHATAVPAETTVSITGGENLQVGGPVAVTVTLQNDSAMEESDLFISYDSALMQFVSGEDAEVQSDGRIRIRGDYDDSATQKIWTLQFNAVAAGAGSVSAEDVWVKDTQGNTDAGVTVNAGTVTISQTADAAVPVAAAAPNAAQAAADPTAAVQDPALTTLAQEIANDGTMSCLVGTEKWMVVEEFGNDILFPHFVETTQFYKGVEVTAGKLNNAEYYILLVRSEDGSQEKFVRYDQETKTFSDIIRLEQGDNCALFLIDPAENAIPAAFTETIYEGYRAWQLPAGDQVDEFAADLSDFYLFFGYNQDGADGWFLFDSVTGGFTRYVETAPAAAPTGEVAANETDASLATRYNNLLSRFDFMVTCIKYVAIALIALLLILLIVNLADKGDDNTKKKDKKKEKQEEKQEKKAAQTAVKPEQKKVSAAETKTADAASAKKAAAPAKKTETSTKKADVPVRKAADTAPAKKAAAPAEKTDAVRETKKMDTVKSAEKASAKKAAAAPTKKATAPAKKAALKADADGFVDDYVEEKDKAAPQNAQEEKAIGVLRPVAKTEETDKETDKSIQDSIEELSRQIQKTMKDEKPGVDVSGLEELTFIDLDGN